MKFSPFLLIIGLILMSSCVPDSENSGPSSSLEVGTTSEPVEGPTTPVVVVEPTPRPPNPAPIFTPAPVISQEEIMPTIPVHFIILRKSDNTMNDHWVREDFRQEILERFNQELDLPDFKFEERNFSTEIVRSDSHYYYSQSKVLDKYDGERRSDRLTIVVASEHKTSSNGTTRYSFRDKPLMVIRSLQNDEDPNSPDYFFSDRAVNTMAGLIRHELGHIIGYNHDGTRANDDGISTENFTRSKRDIAKQTYVPYLREFARFNLSEDSPVWCQQINPRHYHQVPSCQLAN